MLAEIEDDFEQNEIGEIAPPDLPPTPTQEQFEDRAAITRNLIRRGKGKPENALEALVDKLQTDELPVQISNTI